MHVLRHLLRMQVLCRRRIHALPHVVMVVLVVLVLLLSLLSMLQYPHEL